MILAKLGYVMWFFLLNGAWAREEFFSRADEILLSGNKCKELER